MAIFEITDDRLVPLPETRFSQQGVRERDDLQRLLRDQVGVIAPGVLIISEEFGEWEDSRRRIDLLGIDKQANLVVIELKRSEDGGHMELQAVRYAAMVSAMTFEKVVEVYQAYLVRRGRDENAQGMLLEFLEWDEPDEEKFAQDVRIVLVAAEFSRELTSAVLWLNERGLDIRCVRLRPHAHDGRVFVDVQQIIPLPEASDYLVRLREKSVEQRESRRRAGKWSGLWFVNVGMDSADRAPYYDNGIPYTRHWEHCVQYSYISAGNGLKYSEPLRKLEIGSAVLAYQKGAGYVGYGHVTKPAEPMHEMRLEDGTTLAEKIGVPDCNADRSEEKWEYAVGIEWKKHFPLSSAQTFKGVFANPNVVCKLRDPTTVDFVRQRFEISRDGEVTEDA